MKEEKLRQLENSFEEGIISREEYEEKKKEVEENAEKIHLQNPAEEQKDASLKSDKILIIGAVLLLLAFAAVFGASYFFKEKPKTIDDLHALNLKGKLKESQGYIYSKGYSFVKFDNTWYTQFKSQKGTRLYNIQFRYGPKELEPIDLQGSLNNELFNNAADYYVTFNPTGNDFSSVALAVGDFNQHMTQLFFKQPIAACDRNETKACEGRPTITCSNTDKIVLYIRESNNSKVYYDDNCIVVEGTGLNLVKGVDRVLYDLYEIMGQ